ncbi:MAG TPA: methyltransferase domain-containing protein [Methanotrichaceae archaeon]|nr:methyltransferase domain-containing protein [Methanotrichaceae archaeon]
MPKWDPEAYEKSSSAQEKWADEILSRLDLRGDESILDIGCGDGRITARMAARVRDGSVTGIDTSQEMISFANKRFPQSSSPNLKFKYGDASCLNYEDEFDLVTSFACLHWILDHRPVLDGIRRSLRPGGRTFLQFGGRGNAADIFRAVNEVISEERWSMNFREFRFPYGFFGPEEYRAWAEDAGLKVVRVDLVQKDMVQKGRGCLASWMSTTWLPYLERIREDQRQDLINEVVDLYIQDHPLDDNGLVHVGMVRLEVEIEKI